MTHKFAGSRERSRCFLVAVLLVLMGTFAARCRAADVTWPARYGWAEDMDLIDSKKRLPPLLFNVATEAEICPLAAALEIYDVAKRVYCPQPALGQSYCEWGSNPASCDYAPSGFTVGIGPICSDVPATKPPPIGSVPIKYDFSSRTGSGLNHTICTCPSGSRPDLASGMCVLPRMIELKASRTRFKPGGGSLPVELMARVTVKSETYKLASEEPVELSVVSNDGTAGTLTPTSGVADDSGRFVATYRFPENFQRGRVDTIRATCQGCAEPATVDIKMAPTVLGFFNGVWNTSEQAKDGLEALTRLVGPTYRDTPIRYENFYNQTGQGSSSTALQDIAETFAQRGTERDGVLNNRWEHYWDLVAGRHGDPNSLTGSLISGLGNGAAALARLIDATFNATLGQIVAGWARMLTDSPTGADMGAQLATLRALADEESDFVLVAHSQGNLFVNAAYDGLRISHPDTKAKVVHVAPASPTVRGDYGLSSFDIVINGLRVQGLSSVQPSNWSIPFSMVDASGHTLVATYLDAAREGRAKVKALIDSALDGL